MRLLFALLLALAAPAVAEPLDPPRYPDVERPHYLPSWERTDRGYLPSYQYELERRRVCGNMCDDFEPRRRRDPFER